MVTRARGRAAPLTAALQAAGARVVEVPVVEIADPDDGGAALRRAAQAVAAYDWVAFTSANAVHRFVPLLRDSRGFGPARAGRGGRATADALAAYHLVADLVAETADGSAGAEALAARFDDRAGRRPGALPPGRRGPARPARGAGRPGLGGRRGGRLPHRAGAARRRRPWPTRRPCEVVTFTSPSTVDAYLSLSDDAGRPLRVPEVVACIGPTTAEAARRAGLAVAVEAPRRLGRGAGAGGGRPPGGRRAGQLVGWRGWASPNGGCGGCDVPRPCAGWWPRPASASTTWWRRSSCARGSTSPSPSPRCPARSSTRWPRWWPRPSGWPRSGLPGLVLFGVPEAKDATGSGAWDPDGIVQVALGELRSALGDELVLMADLCLDEYTDHGHCGVLTADGSVDNDATLELYGRVALAQAAAGADVVAPSGMMDGQVAAIRRALDDAGHAEVAVLAYAAKYASALYGPFREAVDVTIAGGGDRRAYQQDPANRREALAEVALDVAEGADMVMVKPAITYLDVIAEVPPRGRRAGGRLPRERRVLDGAGGRRAGLGRRPRRGPRAADGDQAGRAPTSCSPTSPPRSPRRSVAEADLGGAAAGATNAEWFARASRVDPRRGRLPGPVVRLGRRGPLHRGRAGEGPYVYDVEGTRYLDLVQSYGAVLLGHAHPAVTEAVRRAAGSGTTFGMPTPGEVLLAEAICERVAGLRAGPAGLLGHRGGHERGARWPGGPPGGTGW